MMGNRKGLPLPFIDRISRHINIFRRRIWANGLIPEQEFSFWPLACAQRASRRMNTGNRD
jgi:hypothetical protein